VCFSSFETFKIRFATLFAEASEIRGEKRSAANNIQGHQKTAAFIIAVLKDAAEEVTKPTQEPRGGFTDVGMHTGGNQRNTAWPIVRSVLHALYTKFNSDSSAQSYLNFENDMVYFHMWIAMKKLTELKSNFFPCNIDKISTILNEAIRELLIHSGNVNKAMCDQIILLFERI
jgi:hypothetical protein